MAMPRPPQLEAAFQQLTQLLTEAAGRPVDLVKESWPEVEKVVIKVLGGAFSTTRPEHQLVALGLAAALGERLHADHQAFWFPYRESPEGASLGFPETLVMLAPFGAAVDALAHGSLARLDELTKTIRTSLAQAKFGGAQPVRLTPEDYMRLFDPGFVQLVAVDPAKLKTAFALTPERAASELRDAINRAPKLPAEAKKQLDGQLVSAVARLESGKPVVASAARAPRVVETVGLLYAATQSTGPAAEEFWTEMVMPLLFTGVPQAFPPLDTDELEAAKSGVDPLFLFLDVVPHQFKSPDEEGLLGAFPGSTLAVPAPEFREAQAPRLIKVGVDAIKPALQVFDAQKTRDAVTRFGAYLKEKGGASQGPAQGAEEAKMMLDAALTLLGDLQAAVKDGQELYVRRLTEAEASSEAALSLVRQALSAPRIILAT